MYGYETDTETVQSHNYISQKKKESRSGILQ